MKWASIFVGSCAAVVPIWWIGLHASTTFRAAFVPPPAWPDFQAVLLPDMLLAVLLAALAVTLWRGRPSPVLVGLTCGAWTYATAFSIAWTWTVGAPGLGAVLMLGACVPLLAIGYVLVSPRGSRIASLNQRR
jgi:hypothetical protein